MRRYPFSDGILGETVRRQAGATSRRQLLEAGLSPRQVDKLVAAGVLIRRFSGVYLLANAETGRRPHLHAALLALGSDAVLSHRTAGALWGICPWPHQIEAIRPHSGAKPPRGIHTHRPASLADSERTSLEGLRVTTVERTLLDLAAVLDQDGLVAAYEAADRQGRVRHPAMRRVLERGGRPGIVALRRLYGDRDPLKRPTRSEFEDEVLAAMRNRPRFEMPENNAIIDGREVDLLWRKRRVMAELDGYRHHAGDTRFNADRARDLAMERRGWRVVRISWEMWNENPEAVLDAIAEILTQQPPAVT